MSADQNPTADTSTSATAKIISIVWIAMGCALIFALLFVLRAGYVLYFAHAIPSISRDVLWMAPLGHLILFLFAALPVLLLAPFVSRPKLERGAVLWLVGVGFFGVLLPWTEIHRLAALALSLGVGVVAMRGYARSPERGLRWTRRVVLALVALFAIAAGAAGAWRGVASRRAIASLPKAADGAPNVLLIILDTVRGSELSLYGYPRPTTPNLDKFAAGGATFDQAMATAPWTLASHATLFTGRYPQWLSVTLTHPLDDADPTIADVLAKRGYMTVGVAGNIFYTSWESGLNRGFLEYHDYGRTLLAVVRSSLWGQSRFVKDLIEATNTKAVQRALLQPALVTFPKPAAKLDAMSATEVTNTFLRFHEARTRDRPYFAFLNYIDAHRPYSSPQEFRRKFTKGARYLDAYDAEIAYVDAQLGRIFTALEQSGELKNTLVIVTSDHGEHQGERGLVGHGNSLYTQLIHVPLVVRFDGRVPAGLRVPNVVSLRDLATTIAELAGAQSTPPFPGTPLSRFWTDAPDSGSAAVAQLGKTRTDDLITPALEPTMKNVDSAMVAIYDDSLHLVRRTTKALEEAFNFRADPTEERDLLSAIPTDAAILREKIRATLQADAPLNRRARATACQRAEGRSC